MSQLLPKVLFRKSRKNKKTDGASSTTMTPFVSSANRILKIASFARMFFIKDVVSVIDNGEDRIKSQRLLYREYRKKDLCASNQSELYFSPYTFLPTTVSFVSKRKDKVIGTISAIGDSVHKLPADLLYAHELDRLRSEGKSLVEVSGLALDSRIFGGKKHSLKNIKKFSSMVTLFTGMVNWVYVNNEASHLVVLVNPKHTAIYEFIGFKQFSEIRYYPRVNKPAVPLILEIDQLFVIQSPASAFVRKNFKVLRPSRKVEFSNAHIRWYLSMARDYFSQIDSKDLDTLLSAFPDVYPDILIRPESSESVGRGLNNAEVSSNADSKPDLEGKRHSTIELVSSHLRSF